MHIPTFKKILKEQAKAGVLYWALSEGHHIIGGRHLMIRVGAVSPELRSAISSFGLFTEGSAISHNKLCEVPHVSQLAKDMTDIGALQVTVNTKLATVVDGVNTQILRTQDGQYMIVNKLFTDLFPDVDQYYTKGPNHPVYIEGAALFLPYRVSSSSYDTPFKYLAKEL